MIARGGLAEKGYLRPNPVAEKGGKKQGTTDFGSPTGKGGSRQRTGREAVPLYLRATRTSRRKKGGVVGGHRTGGERVAERVLAGPGTSDKGGPTLEGALVGGEERKKTRKGRPTGEGRHRELSAGKG